MVNLTIRLSKGSSVGAISTGGGIGGGGGGGSGGGGVGGVGDGSILLGHASSSIDGIPASITEQSITVSCPDHLVLSDLPVAKGVGSVPDVTLVKVLGRKARRRLGDKVHFCVRCDFPIAIYGRLDPCEHIFCLTCARRDSNCYLCGDRVVRIQRMEVLDGIFICGAPRCLRSFIKRQDFQLHVRETHVDLIDLADDKERSQNDVDSQKGLSSETQIQISTFSGSPASAQLLPMQEQRTGQSHPQTLDSQSSRGLIPQSISAPTLDEKQLNRPEFEHQKQPSSSHHNNNFNNININIDRHRRQQRQDRQQVSEENHFEEQAQPDPQQQGHQPPLQQQMQQGMMMMMMPATQPGMIPMFSPQPYPMPPYAMQQEGQGMQPMYTPYQIPPPGGHLLASPPLPQAPRPPSLAPPPPLMPPPPPKRGKFEQGIIPPADPQMMDAQGYGWPGGNPGYDPNRNFGGWPPPPT